MIPRDARRLMVLRSRIRPRPNGPIVIPASSCPTTTGCLSLENRRLKPSAEIMVSPMSSRSANSGLEANGPPARTAQAVGIHRAQFNDLTPLLNFIGSTLNYRSYSLGKTELVPLCLGEM